MTREDIPHLRMSQRDWKDFLPILVDLSSILGSNDVDDVRDRL